jgi:large subunit ribosomal protein L5
MAENQLYTTYKDKVAPALIEKRGYRNPMEVPRVVKVIINTGVGTSKDKDVLTEATDTLGRITGQRPVVTKARKSISNFKLRQGMPVGACVTLRRGLMYNFLYRLINIALPRVRDFRGVPPKAFDGAGNYSMGLSDQSVFTEINLDKVKNTIGTIVTTAKTDDEARDLLAMLGMPFAS